jgi:hypothetical protein
MAMNPMADAPMAKPSLMGKTPMAKNPGGKVSNDEGFDGNGFSRQNA